MRTTRICFQAMFLGILAGFPVKLIGIFFEEPVKAWIGWIAIGVGITAANRLLRRHGLIR